jgi:putative phosphoesterase
MKVGLLSDIHANSDALQVVIRELKRLKVENLIVAGDTVGYYYGILEARSLLSDFNLIEILGNHEKQLISDEKETWVAYEGKYGSGLRRNKEDLGFTGLQNVKDLQHPKSVSLSGIEILISHGAPWGIDEYLYPNIGLEIWDGFSRYAEEIFILGNTHHQMLKKVQGKLIINPGSVGQSRSSIAMADWAILDLEDKSVTFKSTPYCAQDLIRQCEQNDPGLEILTRHLKVESDG